MLLISALFFRYFRYYYFLFGWLMSFFAFMLSAYFHYAALISDDCFSLYCHWWYFLSFALLHFGFHFRLFPDISSLSFRLSLRLLFFSSLFIIDFDLLSSLIVFAARHDAVSLMPRLIDASPCFTPFAPIMILPLSDYAFFRCWLSFSPLTIDLFSLRPIFALIIADYAFHHFIFIRHIFCRWWLFSFMPADFFSLLLCLIFTADLLLHCCRFWYSFDFLRYFIDFFISFFD